MANEVWFIIGMCIPQLNFSWCKWWYGILGCLAFIILSILVYANKVNFYGCSFVLGLFACASVIIGLHETHRSVWLSKFTMPIFLMHTIFAAPIRVLLMKFGILNPIIHVLFGLTISFIGPIVADIVMRKIKYIDFVLYPNRYIKI